MKPLPIGKRFCLKLVKSLDFLFSDASYIRLKFYLYVGYWPNLKNPKTFNEKLQWLKLNNRHNILTKLVDKIEVKQYISEKIGQEYVVPTLQVYDSAEEIDISKLPDKFVLKCNHNSGGIVICRNKKNIDLQKSKDILSKTLGLNYFKVGREWPYKNVSPHILAEKLLENDGNDLPDYKFYCFNGKVGCCLICANRFGEGGLKTNFYDKDWNLLPFTRHHDNISYNIEKPEVYEKMISLAETIASDFKFVRVDFYLIENRIYFGELTFFPGNGWEEFNPIEWDYKLGAMLDLDSNEQKF